MTQINTLTISPSLINTSCAWASDYEQLKALYDSAYTGAVTTRTATADGFKEDASHTVAFTASTLSSINSYGYSPHPLASYLSWIEGILASTEATAFSQKPFIISVAASTASQLLSMVTSIQGLRAKIRDHEASSCRIAIEFNTSCPNIPGSPPKGYILDTDSDMRGMLGVLAEEVRKDHSLTIGLKLPPYVYKEQFTRVVGVVKELGSYVGQKNGEKRNAFAFFTCTNTLGNSLLFPEQVGSSSNEGAEFAVPTAVGGLAGEALHSLALGNVYTFRQLLREDGLQGLVIIGAGGVTTKEAALRMKKAGAEVVGCATLLGREGVRAYEILGKD